MCACDGPGAEGGAVLPSEGTGVLQGDAVPAGRSDAACSLG